jgi:DNA-binding NarL/FixJ family response regulator
MTDFDQDRYAEHLPANNAETSNVSDGFLNRPSADQSPCGEPEPRWLVAATSDLAAPQTFELARLWDEVAAGTWRFRDAFTTPERHFAVIEQLLGAPQGRTQVRNLEILRRVLLGQMPKVIAPDMNIGVSTVATASHDRLQWMGLSCRASSAPVLLAMAACAAEQRHHSLALGRLTRMKPNDDKYWLVSVPRPDLEFPVELSRAEAVVVRQLLAGFTHAEISAQRATSPRTIANQLAAAFKKLGVSGRASILQLLIAYQAKNDSARHASSAAVIHDYG